ncbi:hypothetical protein GCM10023205_74570 [Yinghuangia aomiensis]|uniref:Ferritin-like metal-binding protein YciE n=1 Tax=Yinghuangia aomiensis TaxID=676205 RepID=A0ABP9I9G8_9ACTN
MDGYARLIEDNDSLRDLIQRWRSTTDSAAELLPTAARTLAATARAKDQVLYPAIRTHAPERAALVDEAERINTHVLGFLGQAVEIGPGGYAFVENVHEAIGAADGLLLHERRDLMPALREADWADGAVAEYLTVRETLSGEMPLERLIGGEGEGEGGRAGRA